MTPLRNILLTFALALVYMTAAGCVFVGPDGRPIVNPVVPTPVVPVGKMSVLILWESADNHTREQLAVLNSPKLKSWLDSNDVKWRLFDDDSDMTYATDWQARFNAGKQAAKSLPAFIVFHGDKGVAHPLPATEDEAIALLQKAKG